MLVEKIYFNDKKHRDRVYSYMLDDGYIYKDGINLNSKYLAAYYLLLSSFMYHKSYSYITENKINFNKILECCYAESEVAMVKFVQSIVEGKSVIMSDVIYYLDENNIDLILNAIHMAKHAKDISAFLLGCELKEEGGEKI